MKCVLNNAEIIPSIQIGVMTIVVQDPRPNYAPLARLYYFEEIREIGSRIEGQVRMEPKDFSESERASWKRLRAHIKRKVWEDYKRLIGAHLFPK